MQLKNDIGSGKASASQFSKATGISSRDFADSGIVTQQGDRGRSLDFESMGAVARPSIENSLQSSLSNASFVLQNAKVEMKGAQGASALATAVQAPPPSMGSGWTPASVDTPQGNSSGAMFSPSSAAPSYAQNAFSTPTGFNTSQAMSAGGSNYVDNAKFVSAAESSGANRNDYAEATTRVLENMNTNTDVNTGMTEDMLEQTTQLVEALTPPKEGE